MQDNQDDLSKAITQLNIYLNQGYLMKLTYMRKHEDDSKKEGFDLKQLKEDYEEKINVWLNEVANYLKQFDFQFYFHFILPKDDAMSYMHPLGNLTHALEKYLYALEDVIVRFEERKNLAVRQDIADKEYQADILYEVTFSTHTREIKINNMLLANPNWDSKAMNFFEYVFTHPNEPIEVAKIEETTAMNLANSIQDILRDLGFIGAVRQLFFPVATKNKVMFINPITKTYATKEDLPTIDLTKITRQSEPKREGTSQKSK